MRNSILCVPDDAQLVKAIAAHTLTFTPIPMISTLHHGPTLQNLLRRSQLHRSVFQPILKTRRFDVESMTNTALPPYIRSSHSRDVAFVATITSVISRIAGRCYSGHVVGLCCTRHMAHSEACAEATGEVVRGRKGAGYQGVGEFDRHEDCDQSTGEGYVDV
jgi:hypothetical protein